MIAPVAEIVGHLMAERNLERDALFAARRAERLTRFGPPEPTGYASSAARCARQEGFRIGGVPTQDEYDTKTLITFATGDFLHELVQEALVKSYGAEVEVYFRKDGISGSADALYTLADGRKVVVEIKSVAPYPWEKAIGERFGKPSGTPEGPSLPHVLQAAICAIHLEAGYVHMIYVAKATGAIAEWRASLDIRPPVFWTENGERVDWRPEGKHPGDVSLRELAVAECDRQRSVLAQVSADILPARDYDPNATKFPCGYCRWQDMCLTLPAEACALPAGEESTAVPVEGTNGVGGGASTISAATYPFLHPSVELAAAYVRGCQEGPGVYVLGFMSPGNADICRYRIRSTIILAGWDGPEWLAKFEAEEGRQIFHRFKGNPHLTDTPAADVRAFGRWLEARILDAVALEDDTISDAWREVGKLTEQDHTLGIVP